MQNFRYLNNVTTLELDVEKCIGCGMCGIVCPHTVFKVENPKARIVDQDACMECGACAKLSDSCNQCYSWGRLCLLHHPDMDQEKGCGD